MRVETITHSLAATGYTKMFATDGAGHCSIEFWGPAGTPTHDGTWTFHVCNDPTVADPQQLSAPTFTWSPGAHEHDVAQIETRGARFVCCLYTRAAGGTGETATLIASFGD